MGFLPDHRRRIDAIDGSITRRLEQLGHPLHRMSLGVLFIWMGLLKQFDVETGSSLIADTIYWGPSDVMVPLLGWWEIAIGVGLLVRPLVRVALLLLAIRLPGTALALVLHPDITFADSFLSPTPAGQFLIKDLMLFSAAMVIGGTVRGPHPAEQPEPAP